MSALNPRDTNDLTLTVADELNLGIASEVKKNVRETLENNYTSQYKKGAKKNAKVKTAFTKIERRRSSKIQFKQIDYVDGVIPDNYDTYSLHIDSWGWSAVMAAVLSGGKPLRCTMHTLFDKYGLFERNLADESNFLLFADILENTYLKHKNPYHNSTHAADVLQTVHHLVNATGLYHWLSDLELMAMLFAASIHDAEHTGTTNDFHIATRSPLALLYKDQSVLENHHLAMGWDCLAKANILEPLDRDEKIYFRQLVTEMVLATDMSQHFPQINLIDKAIDNTPKTLWHDVLDDKAEYPKELEKGKIMSLVIHAADISNALKPWHTSHYTSMQILQEFFEQGDKCKLRGMMPPPLCDRRGTDIPMSQINFSKYLVKPTFDLLSKSMRLLAEVFLPRTQNQLRESISKERNSPKLKEQNSSLLGDSGHRSSVNQLGTFQRVFRQKSLRPKVAHLSCSDVIHGCDLFDLTWQRYMAENQERWQIIFNSHKAKNSRITNVRESQRHQTSLPSNSITARAKSLLSAQTDLEDEDSSDADTETICSPSFPSEFKAESPGNLDITISQEQSAEQRTISSDFELDSISLKASDKIEPWPGNEAPE